MPKESSPYTEALLEPFDYRELLMRLGGHTLPVWVGDPDRSEALLEPIDYRELYRRLSLTVP